LVRLVGESKSSVDVLDYGSLSLVEEDDLKAIIAMEGMVSYARNQDIHQYLSFNTRLDAMIFGSRIDESNNPMDPENLGGAFKDSLKPLGFSSDELLLIYRRFNEHVFRNLESVLGEANQTLIANGILPDLDVAARDKSVTKGKRRGQREKSNPEERAFTAESDKANTAMNSQEFLSVMQSLLHNSLGQQAGNVAPAENQQAISSGEQQSLGGNRVELIATDELVSLVSKLQSLPASPNVADKQQDPEASSEPVDLGKSLEKLLQSDGDENSLKTIDAQAADIIKLVSLLYEEIWQDQTVPIPMKDLIGRTQISFLKIALLDPNIFDTAVYPARELLNELATAGISWTEHEKLDQDPMYGKVQEVVERFNQESDGDLELLGQMRDEFIGFKKQLLLKNQESEHILQDAAERTNRLDEINQYALGKISERILHEDIDPFVRTFLEESFHKFVVEIILREGPGGVSWKPVMNTVDVLLWTVSPSRNENDREKFIRVNRRLLINLGKALDIAGIDKAEADDLLKQLQSVQDECFRQMEVKTKDSSGVAGLDSESAEEEAAAESSTLPDDDEHVIEVGKYPIGIWLEFDVDGEKTIRCTLAAKIATIDKYVFVNREGVKVIEKSKSGLAKELKEGTVKVISEAPLLDRAMESVIGRLRNEQQESAVKEQG
jgi:hypothetical protein